MSAGWSAPPAEFSAALAKFAEEAGGAELRLRATRISQGFRGGQGSRETIRDGADALAYALTRLPATYAADMAALRALAEARPDFAPQSLLDAGCGLGGAAVAARALWPRLAELTLFDRNAAFLRLLERLCAEEPLAGARIAKGDLTAPPEDLPAADLVVASYALTEVPDEALPATLSGLWRRSLGALVLVEPGTPRDYARLMRARDLLIAAGASIAAPCPHAAPCPLIEGDWCHFAVRLPRSRDHKRLKGADAPFEDEKFSYLAATRSTGSSVAARIVAPPKIFKWGTRLRLCVTNGIKETNIEKRDKPGYRAIRKKIWGDAVDPPEGSQDSRESQESEA